MNHFYPKILGVALVFFSGITASATDWTYIEDMSGNPQGGVIIRYPDLAEPNVRDLSHQLSRHGWSSVLVPITPRTVAKGQTDTEALIDHMKSERGKYNLVLVSIGNTWDESVSLQDVTNEDGDIERPIQAVVLVDVPGEFPLPGNIPVLDITTSIRPLPGYELRQDVAQRDGLTKNLGVALRYSTRRKPQTDFQKHQESFLTRRIRGWLYKNARGMKLSQVQT